MTPDQSNDFQSLLGSWGALLASLVFGAGQAGNVQRMAYCPFSFPGIVGWQLLHIEVEVEAGFKPWSSLERHSLKEGAACNLQPLCGALCVRHVRRCGAPCPPEPGWAGASREQAPSSVSAVAMCCHLLPHPFVAGFPTIPGLRLQGLAGRPAVERVAGGMQADIT